MAFRGVFHVKHARFVAPHKEHHGTALLAAAAFVISPSPTRGHLHTTPGIIRDL
jgi:hypothetical protein